MRVEGDRFDVEQCSGCWDDAGTNQQFISEAVSQAAAMGVTIGIYSSVYEWGQVVGDGWTGEDVYPMWYANYDGEPNYNDWQDFGGWTSPSSTCPSCLRVCV